MYKVSSEIYAETDYEPTKSADGKVVSKFRFNYPAEALRYDKDGDLLVRRECDGIIEIEHSDATELRLVGLQVWRGALLIADFLFHQHEHIYDKQIMELGAGVGLASIAAAIYAKKVICTDVDIGGILQLIRENVKRNNRLLRAEVQVMECDFKCPLQDYSDSLLQAIDASDVFLAADVIYDDELTDAFIALLDGIFKREVQSSKKKIVYIALEKRYVFTLADLDTVAPMFEYFLKQSKCKSWRFEYLPLNFPQFFQYERCKQLVLLKVTSGN